MNHRFAIAASIIIAASLLPLIAGFTKCAGPEAELGWLTVQCNGGADAAAKEREVSFVFLSSADSEKFYSDGGDTKGGALDFGPMLPGEYRVVGTFESGGVPGGDKPQRHTLFAPASATITKHERTIISVKPTGPVGVASLEVTCAADLATPGKATHVTVLLSEQRLDMSAARLSTKTAFDSKLVTYASIEPGARAVFEGVPKGHYHIEAVGGLDQGEEPKSLAHAEVEVTAKDMNTVTLSAAK